MQVVFWSAHMFKLNLHKIPKFQIMMPPIQKVGFLQFPNQNYSYKK